MHFNNVFITAFFRNFLLPLLLFSGFQSQVVASVENSDSIGSSTPILVLESGFDKLNQLPTNNKCVTDEATRIIEMSSPSKTFNLELVKNRQELATALHITEDYAMSMSYGGFTGSGGNKKELIVNTSYIEETTLLVVSIHNRFRTRYLESPSRVKIDDFHAKILLSGNGDAFREYCGDGFISSVDIGRSLDFTFQLRSQQYSREEIRRQTENLKIDITGYANGGYSGTRKEEIHKKYSRYQVEVKAIALGSNIPVSTVVDLPTALEYLKQFESESTEVEAPIFVRVTNYTPPESLPISNYPNYLSVEAPVKQWYQLDRQLALRCELFDELISGQNALRFDESAKSVLGISLRQQCYESKKLVLNNLSLCNKSSLWSRCVSPTNSNCLSNALGESCMAFVQKIPVWSSTVADVVLKKSTYGETTYRKSACLALPLSMLDFRVNMVDCLGKSHCPAFRPGISVKTSAARLAKHATNSWNDTSKCLTSKIDLDGARSYSLSLSAVIDQVQTINGLSASFPEYLIH